MKNNRIVRAYDSINPTDSQKEKMLEAILSQAAPEEPPRKKRETVVYSTKPRKNTWRSILPGLAAMLAVVVFGGFTLGRLLNRPEGPSHVEPTKPTANVTVNMSYIPVLEKYRTALREGWSKEQCEIEGISTRFYMPEPVDFTVGKRILDINDDGRAELLSGHGEYIWDLYTTLEDGTPIQLLSDVQDGWQYYICEDQLILSEYYSKDDCYVEYYRLEGHSLVMERQLQYRDGQWMMESSEQEWKEMSEREVQDLTNSIKKLTPDWLPLEMDEDTSVYDSVIEKYRSALTQSWPRELCIENGLSVLTPIESEYQSLYFDMYDLDGNGVEELIISEYPYRENTDTGFLDIYTLINGKPVNILSSETILWSLCEGGYVKKQETERAGYISYVSFWNLAVDEFTKDSAVYQRADDGQWFTEGYRGVGAAITRAEADEIIAGYPPLKLDFTEIKPTGKPEQKSGYEAFDHILQKYVTAINESWTAQRCEENDISPQILEGLAGYQTLGWCLEDIDSNGVEELIISDGVYLYDLYVMMPHDGSPGHLVCGNGGETWQLCDNGVIQNHGLYSGTSAWRYYTLKDTDMIQRDIVFYDGELNQYYYGADGENLEPIAKDQVGDLLMRDRTSELTLTPFVERPTVLPDEAEHYEPLLNIYRQAIREKWKPGDCVQKGISLMVGHYGDFVEDLGYATMDLDGNGVQELIITDGRNIYDLYTIVDDEEYGPVRLVDAMERIEYFLLTDGRIYSMGSGSASVSYYTFYELKGRELKLLEGYILDLETNPMLSNTDPENPWYYYDGKEQGANCPSEIAAAAVDSAVFAQIPFVSFE